MGGKSFQGSDDKSIKLWNIETGTLINTFKGHEDWIHSIYISPDGRKIISGDHESIKIWDTETGALINTLEMKSSNISISDDQLIKKLKKILFMLI